VTWRRDAEEFLPLEGWAVVRQDARGNRFDICMLPLEAHAECLAAHLEARVHASSFSVELRGMPPTREHLRRGWSFVHPDAHDSRERSYFAEPAMGP
jgi:hypothetical protein